MIKAAIFDMDGLLIDSEPLWQEVEVDMFRSVGIPMTKDMSPQTIGLRIDQAIAYWYEKYPWKDRTQEDVMKELMEKIIAVVKERGEPKEGALETLKFMKTKGIKTAIASSSPMSLIETVIKRLEIETLLDGACSAEHEEYGKPHPAVYLAAAKSLKISPENCLAFEDSYNGILSAKAACMKCVSVPDVSIANDKRIIIADAILMSLTEFNENVWNSLNQ